jgi:predicted phosphoribosyltransferase
MARFADRVDAGRKLADALVALRPDQPVVIGLPRGGVIVAFEVARALQAPLDVLVARKIGAPGQPEYAIGAIAPDGVTLLDDDVIAQLSVGRDYLDRAIAEETAELRRREALYREGAPPVDVAGRTAIVVDDGLATGFTASAALASLRRRQPERLIFAAPVCAPGSSRRLHDVVDEVVCVKTPLLFRAVGEWYQDFDQTTDEEVIALLREARGARVAT